jgi:hypothetical protein
MSQQFKRPRLRAGVYFLTLLTAVSAAAGRADAQPAAPTSPPAGNPPAPAAASAPAPAPSGPSVPAETAAPAGAQPDAATAAPPPDASADAGGEVSSGSGLFESAQGDSGEGDAGTGDAAASSGVDLNGYVRGDVFIGKRPDKGQAQLKATYSELVLKLRARKEKYGDAYAEPRFRYGLQGEERALFVDLREAYVNLYAGPLDLRLGKQIVVWGRADALNPTSNITPVDFRIHSPVEDDRRVGNVGARAFLNFSPVRIEGVWMPLYSATELPPLPLPERVFLGPERYPPPLLKNGLEAVRVHLELPAVELSASYLYGYAPLPGLDIEAINLTGDEDANVVVSRKAYEQHVLGFDFATTLGEFGVRGEVAYRVPLHHRRRLHAPNPDVQYVLGLDRTFGEVSVLAQYIGRYTINWAPEFTGNASTDELEDASEAERGQVIDRMTATLRGKSQILFNQLARVQNLATLRLEWLTLQQTLSLSALGMMNFTTKEWLLFPKLGYQLSDTLSTTVGAEIYAGPDDTLFGVIDTRLSAGYAELKMSF